jgi:putative flippase GtrA/4-amino-4-deoxy-L-arabinose transferase-like glycosyltransferase
MLGSARATLLSHRRADHRLVLGRSSSKLCQAGRALRSDRARPLRFVAIGALAGLVQLALLQAWTGLGWDSFLANVGAFILSAQVNFWGSQFFTWGDRRPGRGETTALAQRWTRFHVSISGTALLNMSIFAIARTAIPAIPAAALGIGLAAFLNFILGDRFVFRPTFSPDTTSHGHMPRLRSIIAVAVAPANRTLGWPIVSAIQYQITRAPLAARSRSVCPAVFAAEHDIEEKSSLSSSPPPAPESRPGLQLPLAVTVLFLLAFALALRVYGIGFGLPQLYYWDEPAVVNRAVRFGSGDFNPHFFYYPALYMYVEFVVSGLYFMSQLLTGRLATVEDFAVQYFVDPTGVYLAARLTTALIGTACVLTMFFVGRRYFNPLAGCLAALFLSSSVLHATQSHIAVTDIPHSLFILLALLPIYRVAEAHDSRWQDYALAGALIGLGAATKYFAILLVAALMVAHFVNGSAPFKFAQDRPRILGCWWSTKLMVAGTATAIAFFVGSPFNVLDFRSFVSDYQNQLLFSGVGAGSSAGWLFTRVLPASLGWPIYLLAIAGMVLTAGQRKRVYIPLFVFPVLYFIVVSRAGVVFARYIIPMELFFCLFAAFAIVWCSSAIIRYISADYDLVVRCGTTVTVMICIVWPIYSTLRWDASMSLEKDSRTAALEWMEEHIASGSIVAIQSLFGKTYLNVPLMTDLRAETIAQQIPRGDRFDAVRQRVASELHRHVVYVEVPFVYDLDFLESSGVRYVLISDQNWLDVDREIAELGSAEMKFKEELNARTMDYADRVLRPKVHHTTG